MANNSLKVSELPTAANVAGTDRIVVLRDPAGSPSVRTVDVNAITGFAQTTSYNPNFCTNTGNVNSNGVQAGNYTKTGKICYFRVYVQFGNSSYADGSGQYQITLPFPSAATVSIRGGALHNLSTASVYHISGMVDVAVNNSIMPLYYTGGTTDLAWKNTTPVSWSSGNNSHFDISGIYETTT